MARNYKFSMLNVWVFGPHVISASSLIRLQMKHPAGRDIPKIAEQQRSCPLHNTVKLRVGTESHFASFYDYTLKPFVCQKWLRYYITYCHLHFLSEAIFSVLKYTCSDFFNVLGNFCNKNTKHPKIGLQLQISQLTHIFFYQLPKYYDPICFIFDTMTLKHVAIKVLPAFHCTTGQLSAAQHS